MAQNIYDDPDFFAGYSRMRRSVLGLAGVPEWLTSGVFKYHRRIGTTLNALIAAGFAIRHVDKWAPTAADLPALADETERPMLMIVAAQR